MNESLPSGLKYYAFSEEIKQELGMVIPVWFPEGMARDQIRRIVLTALRDCELYVLLPHLKVVVDGYGVCHEVLQEIQTEFEGRVGSTFDLLTLQENRGKGGAVCAGMRKLLDDGKVRYLSVRDADGDHFLNDLPNLFRMGKQISEETSAKYVGVMGRRASLHRPLGFQRGEYEILLDRIVLETLKFALAKQDKVLNMQYFSTYGEAPDFQSGYKLYNAESARLIVTVMEIEGEKSPDYDIVRYGIEIVPVVEILLKGGVWGEVNRMTYNEQPTTAYGGEKRVRFYGGKTAWLFRRLDINASQAAQFLDNAILRNVLSRDPDGLSELMAFRAYVLRVLQRAVGGQREFEPEIFEPAYC